MAHNRLPALPYFSGIFFFFKKQSFSTFLLLLLSVWDNKRLQNEHKMNLENSDKRTWGLHIKCPRNVEKDIYGKKKSNLILCNDDEK